MTDKHAQLVQDFENGALARTQPPPRRKLRLRRWAIMAVLFFAAGAVGHVVVKGAANVAHELRQ